jgi:hypothetical protein
MNPRMSSKAMQFRTPIIMRGVDGQANSTCDRR